ncbi:MAG: hypothetical protein LBC80_06245, partial [Treponema sp.]|nr:hypothetical protein [Treponema sp.]
MKRNKRRIFITLLVFLVLSLCSGCAPSSGQGLSFEHISYRDIPGVTAQEIAAIEALKEQTDFFIHASTFGTEAFVREDGQIGGYITLFSNWLSNLFGIQFVPQIHDLTDLYAKLNSGEIDFAGITVAPRFRDIYISSDPIANRSVKV